MKYPFLKNIGFILILFSLSATAAEDFGYQCSNSQVDVQRHIQVAYIGGSGSLPCEVRYYKGNQMRVLWSARNTKGYCEAKAASFAKKQNRWGWKCDSVVYEKSTKES